VIEENKARDNVGVPRIRTGQGEAWHTSRVTRHTSHVTRHTSHITRHTAGKRQTASEKALIHEEKKTEFDDLFDEALQ